jgi:hypothetical protein
MPDQVRNCPVGEICSAKVPKKRERKSTQDEEDEPKYFFDLLAFYHGSRYFGRSYVPNWTVSDLIRHIFR